ncbi:hypothetical protein HNP84_000223 [Thermocatellispora tengchongensis]|uniref:Uncharacterized protein n=1 Tax=Thermocatellispora tengchongensis TaxID=1073253 RepID=A0A840P3B3_9ACTN|nr:hypothetical protein [Thermocatellispora tengchongensis]MBB5130535.1 hypothetical protein [Thermocatellispora tengchongensis]
MTDDPMVAALLREREGYVQGGLDDRVAAVDEQLALRGHTPPSDAPPTTASGEKAQDRSTPPRRRRAPRKDTT